MLSRIPPKLPIARSLRLPSIQARSVTTVPFRLPAARNEPNVSNMAKPEKGVKTNQHSLTTSKDHPKEHS